MAMDAKERPCRGGEGKAFRTACIALGLLCAATWGGCRRRTDREGQRKGWKRRGRAGRRAFGWRGVPGKRRRRRRGFGNARKQGPPLVEVRPGVRAVVTHVVDGDTFYLRLAKAGMGKMFRVRLAGINAPECVKDRIRLPDGRSSSVCTSDHEFYGLQSYRVLRDLVEGREAQVGCELGEDGLCKRGNYGRYLLDLTVDGLDVADEMVRRGAALAFTKYFHPGISRLCKAEDRARQEGRGMWKGADPGSVVGRMSRKTRAWYRWRDERCRAAGTSRLR